MIKLKVRVIFNNILLSWAFQGGYQSKMKDRVQYPAEKKKKQLTPEDKKTEGSGVEIIMNGAKQNGALESQKSQMSNGFHKGL